MIIRIQLTLETASARATYYLFSSGLEHESRSQYSVLSHLMAVVELPEGVFILTTLRFALFFSRYFNSVTMPSGIRANELRSEFGAYGQ